MITHTVHIEGRERLDAFLARHYSVVSRSFLQKLCSTDQVLVNDQAEKSGFKLKEGDVVSILYDINAIDVIEDIDLPIVYQDDDVVVINKPAGVISHARGRYWNEPSVASFIRQLSKQDGERAGIVHRLDRPTSGIMICAKTQAAMTHLQKQFADRVVTKTYLAVAEGHLNPSAAIIDMAIERNPKLPSTFRVGPNGKTAQTQYEVIQSSEKYDLVKMIPRTGRTHQLRVHLKHSNHPILGDTLYGGIKADRLFLHARSLEIVLPNGKKTLFEAALPEEFNEVMGS